MQPPGAEGAQITPTLLEDPTEMEEKQPSDLPYYFPSSGLKFRQQISLLLKSVNPSYHKAQKFDQFFVQLKSHLLILPSSEPVKLEKSSESLRRKNIKLPLPDPTEPVEWKFGFKPPKDVQIIGSWSLKNGIRKPKTKGFSGLIDILVQIPTGFFQEKDYTSNRYLHKRAHYLANIALSLSNLFTNEYQIEYSYLHDDPFKPVILVEPNDDITPSPRWVARLLLSYSESDFPIARLAPSKANLRTAQPTPQYNQAILTDCTELNLRHYGFFNDLANRYIAFPQTCQLLKVWAHQNGFYTPFINGSKKPSTPLGLERFGWLANFIVAHVLLGSDGRGGSKATGPSVVQSDPAALWRQVIDWLAKWNTSSVISMNLIDGCEPFPLEEFSQLGSGLIDITGRINLTAGIPHATLRLLCQCASRTSLLLKSAYDVFDCIFTKSPHKFATTYDYHFVIRPSQSDIDRICAEHEKATLSNALLVIATHLDKALGNRVTGFAAFRLLHSPESIFPSSPKSQGLDLPNNSGDSSAIQIGFLLDPSHAFDLVTNGPSPETSALEVEQFRDFWGTRSELRRFQDGSIKECVSWPVSHPLERLKILKQIVRWLLIEKLSFTEGPHLWDFIGQFDSLILEHPSFVNEIYDKDPKELGFTNVMRTFNEFIKELKELNENSFLPLSITSVQPVSEYLRYSSVFVPGPRKSRGTRYKSCATKCAPLMTCQIKFESSGKWPEGLEAIQKIKAAMLAKIHEGLVLKGKAIKAELVFDCQALPIEQNVVLNVLHPAGYCFQLEICYEREEFLLQEQISGQNAIQQDVTFKAECPVAMAKQALVGYQRKFKELRRHHDAIAALQTRFPSFTYTVRLIKRWLSSHMLLSIHISNELVEMLASAVYLLSQEERPPTTGSGGFLRFLKLMARWDWRKDPLLIPLKTSIGMDMNVLTHFPLESVRVALQNFRVTRKMDPGLYQSTYFIATEQSLQGTCWMFDVRSDSGLSRNKTMRPDSLVADRIQMLARSALGILESVLEAGQADFNFKTIFKSPMKDYDFILVLDASVVYRAHQTVDEIEIIKKGDSRWDLKMTDMGNQEGEPIPEFIKVLESLYGELMRFFYDQFGGLLIGGVIDPRSVRAPKTMKVEAYDFLRKVVKETGAKPSKGLEIKKISRAKVMVDMDATIDEIKQIGKGVIDRVMRKGVDY